MVKFRFRKAGFTEMVFYFLQKPILPIFVPLKMVAVAQLVRASDCGSEGRRFEPG